MTKRREMVGSGYDQQRIEHAEICKTIKNNAEIHDQDKIIEWIEEFYIELHDSE